MGGCNSCVIEGTAGPPSGGGGGHFHLAAWKHAVWRMLSMAWPQSCILAATQQGLCRPLADSLLKVTTGNSNLRSFNPGSIIMENVPCLG